MHIEKFQTEKSIVGDTEEDTLLLRKMAKSARLYIQSFTWCPPIEEIWLAYGIGGIVAVFLIKFTRPVSGGDQLLWVIDGDLPNAYLVTDEIHDAKKALEAYCDLMEEWINSVQEGRDLKNVFPVRAEPTAGSAALLSSRITYILKKIVPTVKN